MKVRLFPVILIVLSFSTIIPATLRAQSTKMGEHGPGGVIDVQVRYANGQPGPRSIHVRLESAEGGPVADCMTTQEGRCHFTPSSSGVFMVRMEERGYKEASARVEIIGINRGYAVLELKPLKEEPKPDASPIAKDASVAAGSLNIPDKAQQEFEKGEDALKAKQPEEGAKHFEKAIKQYENYPEAYRMLGEAYLDQKDWKKAETALKRSIELDPKVAASYVDLGAVENQQQNYPAAEEALKKGLALAPDAAAAKYELAKTYWAMGRWQDAAPLAEETVTALPELATAHVLMANIYLKKRDGASALREYQEYLRLEPEGTMAPQVREVVAKIQASMAK
jgi:tetratricopeptide (TPR) repeat protein